MRASENEKRRRGASAHPAFFEKLEAQRLPKDEYTTPFQAISNKLLKAK
jgi:hypothetical protein